MTTMAASDTAHVPCPSTEVGRVLITALKPDFDPHQPPVWRDHESFLAAMIHQGGSAVVMAAMLIVFGGLFGQPPDVRAITRRLQEYRDRLPWARSLPMREIEGQIRAILGEYWLVGVVNFDRLVDAGPPQLAVWRELTLDYLAESGQDASMLVCTAEREAAPGGLAWQGAERLRSMVAEMLEDPDSPVAQHPGLRALRRAIEGEG
jgi:hypothetical protein